MCNTKHRYPPLVPLHHPRYIIQKTDILLSIPVRVPVPFLGFRSGGLVHEFLEVSQDSDVLGRREKVLPPALHVLVHLWADAMGTADRHQAIRESGLQRELFETACSICSVCDAVKELASVTTTLAR